MKISAGFIHVSVSNKVCRHRIFLQFCPKLKIRFGRQPIADISRFSVNEIKPLIVPARIFSRRLHQPEELINGIDLDYPQNSLALEVAAFSSRTFPEQFQYAFYLRDAKGNVLNKKFSNEAQFLMENLTAGKIRGRSHCL